MGLLKAAGGAIGGVLADQWREFFYCDALPDNVIVKKVRNVHPHVRAMSAGKITSSPTARSLP